MTAEELIEFLQDFDPETEVRIAHQPNYPFEYAIDDIVIVDGIIYIGEGDQLGYLPGTVADELNW